MSVQFPRDFMVSHDRKIQEGDFEPGFERRPLAMYGIEMPVYFNPVIEIVIPQQAKAVTADLVRLGNNFFHLTAHVFAQQSGNAWQLLRQEEERSSS